MPITDQFIREIRQHIEFVLDESEDFPELKGLHELCCVMVDGTIEAAARYLKEREEK